ncbi:hypothetical protein DFP72DRAFT_927672 [Ephemerocybe angulata]|uniref:Uncharacterized protein n=1 Tax=Ephemerocybe angulata TaxID=980116 RepID=A0A8H6LUT8_9AGAR|nr:hypothetical protein DFP72DRAFT_927672 [Tulosesus angulatus]
MLGASWAQKSASSLRLARKIQPWRISNRHVALALPKLLLQEVNEHPISTGFTANTISRERSRAPRYSTAISSVADQAVALLKAKRVEEAAAVLSRFSEPEANEQVVVEVVERFMGSEAQWKDSDCLFTWFESFPDATTASSDVFHRILDSFLDHRGNDLALLRRLGVLCASKGYQDFVSIHISPVMLKHATPVEAADWEHQLSLSAATFKGLQSEKVVLEEDAQDYEPPAPRAPTIIQLVEGTLPATLPTPSSEDQLVFEDLSDEYTVFTSPLESAGGMKRATDILVSLVRESKFSEAHALLQELDDLGTPLPPRPLFDALKSIAKSLHSPDAKLDADTKSRLRNWFADYLALIPPAHLSLRVYRLARTLLQSSQPDLALIEDTVMVLASKGYTKGTGRLVRFLCSHPNSGFDVHFVNKVEESLRKARGELDLAGEQELLSEFRGPAIQALGSTGRFDSAVQLLPDPSISEARLDKSVYDVLLRQIIQAFPAGSEYESMVLCNIPPTLLNTKNPGLPSLPISIPDIEALEQAFAPGMPAPHPQAILQIIGDCISDGRTNDLTRVLIKVMSLGPLHISAFIQGEMLYYYRQDNYEAVVETIVDHCYLGGGLPRAVVHMFNGKEPRTKTHRFHDETLLDMGRNAKKIWPTTSNCNLLWTTVISQAKLEPHITSLYNRLVHTIEGAYGLGPRTRWLGGVGLRRRVPNAAAFVPLIDKAIMKIGLKQGDEILRKIVGLGLKPTIAHLSVLMHGYARRNYWRRVLLVMSSLEANIGKGDRLKDGGARLPYGTPKNVNNMPIVPDVAFYVSIARGLMVAGNLEKAKLVARRAPEKLGVEVQSDPYLEALVSDLEVRMGELTKHGKSQGVEVTVGNCTDQLTAAHTS